MAKDLVDEDCHSDLERYLTPEDTIEPESSLPSIEELTKNVQNLIDKDLEEQDEDCFQVNIRGFRIGV